MTGASLITSGRVAVTTAIRFMGYTVTHKPNPVNCCVYATLQLCNGIVCRDKAKRTPGAVKHLY